MEFRRKPRPLTAAQRSKRRALDALDRRVESSAGAVTSGVMTRAAGRRQRDDSFGSRLRQRLRPSSGAQTWRV